MPSLPLSPETVPSEITSWYDRGTSARRVTSYQARGIVRRNQLVGDEFVVVHTYGRDYWRENQFGEWRMTKTSDEAAASHGPTGEAYKVTAK